MGANLPQQPTFAQLQQKLDAYSFKKQVHEQVCKDLELTVESLDYNSNELYAKLLDILRKYFIHILENQPGKLPNIIYRVDVNESKLRRNLAEKGTDASLVISKMILEREMLKVFYRNVYNGSIKL